MAQADVPEAVAAGLRLGRMVALLKPSGGIRALVIFRRLVSRTVLHALAGGMRPLPARPLSTTAVNVDGVGAYNYISRKRMFDGPLAFPALAPLIPVVRRGARSCPVCSL